MQFISLEMTNEEFNSLSKSEVKRLETYRKALETKEGICLVLEVHE